MSHSVAKSCDETIAAPVQGRGRLFLNVVSPYLVAVAISCLLLFRIYRLNTIDLRVPLGWVSDNLFHQAMVKNFMQGRHFYVDPWLGAPGAQELYDFPMPYWIHVAVLFCISVFTSNPGLAINILYLLSYVLITITCLYAFRRLGISAGLAVAGAILFAFIPYHLYRAEGHLFLSTYYMVPLIGMVAAWLGTGHELFRFGHDDKGGLRRAVTRDGVISLAACVLVGWDHPYYAFFGAYLIAVGGLLGAFRYRVKQSLITAAILVAVLVSAFGVALLPNLADVHKHGRTSAVVREPIESERYGLTLIQLLAPVSNHRIHVLAKWKDYYNNHALLMNENDSVTLGLIGGIGFLALLVCLFVRHCDPTLYSFSILTICATLMGTVGGIGAIFAFVFSPELRGYNRICVYIAFFSIGAVLVLLDQWLKVRQSGRRRVFGFIVAPVLLLLIGISDQVAIGGMRDRPEIEAMFWQDAQFVQRIESVVPPNAMIFQLPYVPFPEALPVNRMADYDELKGYLHSDRLRWSYGAIKGRATDHWLAMVSAEPVDEMLRTVADKGFAGIYIDRNGYVDHAAALESEFSLLLETEPIVGENGRLAFYRLDAAAISRLERPLSSNELVTLDHLEHPISAEIGDGCWPKEEAGGRNWQWCGTTGAIVVTNPSHLERRIALEGTLFTGYKTPSSLWITGPSYSRELTVNSDGTRWKSEVTVLPGESVFRLVCDCKRVLAPVDPREMYFQIDGFRYHDSDTPQDASR